MGQSKPNFQFLNANALRLLAVICMTLDHLQGAVFAPSVWMHCAGRLAFPIFAFQISEGFLHTAHIGRYAKRLLVFAFLSEIPFDLLLYQTPFCPVRQNVLFTLVLGLWAIAGLDRAQREPGGTNALKALLGAAAACLLAQILLTDYGAFGVATVILFYLFRGFEGARFFQLAAMVILYILLVEEEKLPLFGMQFPVQGLCVLALIPIWLYNGRKGKNSKLLQYAGYGFYPLHMLTIYCIRIIIAG